MSETPQVLLQHHLKKLRRASLPGSARPRAGEGRAVCRFGAAGVEVARDVLAETQAAILPLVPDFDTLRWVFIAVALGGTAVTLHARIDDRKRGRR